MLKTLDSFPEDFKPLIIVTGDRREIPPQSKGDLLAYSVSSTDVMYMNHLNILPDEEFTDHGLVVSDKQFVEESEEVLQERFGSTNILVVGSPAVNLLARRINDQCLFRFAISENAKIELEEQYDFIDDNIDDDYDLFIYNQCLEGIFDSKTILARYIDLLPNIDRLKTKVNKIVPEFKTTKICKNIKTHRRPTRYLMHKLDIPGIFDPTSGTVRGKRLGPNVDYGLITITKNPFSDTDEYSLVYVAGVHGPGTALGLKKLAEKDAFTMHPLGGVFDVHLKKQAVYFERILSSDEMWETPGYRIEDVKSDIYMPKNIQVFLSSPARKSDTKQKKFNNEIKNLIHDICIKKGIYLEIEGPYTLAFGRRMSFWQTVLDFEKDCEFVLHDITDFARGVMIEVGFSVGVKKHFFLIWNTQKTKIAEYSLPELLPVSNLEEINIRNKSETRMTLRNKIINPALDNKSVFDCLDCSNIQKPNNSPSAYVYCPEPQLEECINEALSSRKIQRLHPNISDKEILICKVCDILRISDFVFIQLSESDPNGFILLGMSKAFKLKPKILTLDKFGQRDFAWAEEVQHLHPKGLSKQLSESLSIYFNT